MYQPSPEILEKYARVLINFALNSGEGVRPGEVVHLRLPEAAKPFYVPLRNAIITSGAHPIIQYEADGVAPADIYELSSDEQLSFFPAAYYQGLAEQINHRVVILAEADKYELKGVAPQKILARANTLLPYRQWLDAKEGRGELTWTIAAFATPAMAEDVGMTLEEYWEQIIQACYLDQADPIACWKETFGELERIRTALNMLEIERLHVEGDGIDLWVGIGPNRAWLGGSGRNIPSFELFISPDWRQTSGEVQFNQPLYYASNVIRDIYLRFEEGRVVESRASEGEALLQEMLASPNADRIGEFSLTDRRFSKLTRLMGETLFDENIGGPEGNTHIAVGSAYKDSYPGDQSEVSAEDWEAWGFNQSPVHTDIISTTKRKVTALLQDGTEKVIYEGGEFQL